MSRAVEYSTDDIVGINWGSTNFRAYRLAVDGRLVDEFTRAAGVAGLGKTGMAELLAELMERWPPACAVYASGMIGSNIGWCEVPYVVAPAGVIDVAKGASRAAIGTLEVSIAPGICCNREFDDGPDILRGEEIELFGFASLNPGWSGLAALPGTHTKWVRFDGGRITDFFTSMSGEMFDRLTAAGLLASIVEGEARDCAAFHEGVRVGYDRRLGLGTLLFGARARVMRGRLSRADAASYLRGLLIGSEIADARAIHPELAKVCVPLIGSAPVCRLYASALSALGVASRVVDSRDACIRGFLALHLASAPRKSDSPKLGEMTELGETNELNP